MPIRRSALLAVIALGIGCGKGPLAPVAAVTISPRSGKLPFAFCLPIQMTWEVMRPTDPHRLPPRVFVHLLDRPYHIVRTFDFEIHEAWTPGRKLSRTIDLCQSALADPLPAGGYMLTIGLYEPGTNYRWPLVVAGDDIGHREYRVATIAVSQGGVSAPFFYRGGWGKLESGADQQVVASRMIVGPAFIRTPHAPAQKLRIAIAGSGASITSTCDPAARQSVAAKGVVKVPACEGGEITIVPRGGPVRLESLAWLPP